MKRNLESMNRTHGKFALVSALTLSLSASLFAWNITGQVKSGSTPLSGVAVTVQDSSKFSTTTDANGNFSFQTTGIVGRDGAVAFQAQLSGDELTVQSPVDGALQLALVDATGRSIWETKVTASNGLANASLPASLRTGAIFLRIRHAGAVEYQAVTLGSKGMQVAPSRSAARSMATYPTLIFKKSGYNDTTYKMTSESQTAVAIAMTVPTTCELPTTFKWKDYGKPIAEPKNGWLAIKDFTLVRHNNQYIVYMTYTPSTGGFEAAYMAPFADFSQANAATQAVMPNRLPGVAPELIYFTPKKQWIFTTQWCGNGFCYTTGTDPTKPTSFNATTQSLLSENITTAGNPLEGNKSSDTGPIDQVVICDDSKCYLFYNDDNGRVYRASMPKANFPGKFSGSQMIIQDTKTRLFEAVEVYKLKGQKKYLMIVECAWTRYFRAFTATDLGGEWKPLGNTREENTPFAGAKNVTGGWSTDISHGELVRTGPDEYREIDPCNLQLVYQGKNGGGDYNKLPYRMGLLTAIK